MADYPLNGSQLARVILRDQSRVREYTTDDYKFVQHGVRAKLREFGCPKQDSALRANWMIDEPMARRVADALGRPLP